MITSYISQPTCKDFLSLLLVCFCHLWHPSPSSPPCLYSFLLFSQQSGLLFPLSTKVSFYLLMDLDLRMVKKQSSLFLSLLVHHQSVLISGITCSGLQCQTWICWFKQYVTLLTQLNLQFQALYYLQISSHSFTYFFLAIIWTLSLDSSGNAESRVDECESNPQHEWHSSGKPHRAIKMSVNFQVIF